MQLDYGKTLLDQKQEFNEFVGFSGDLPPLPIPQLQRPCLPPTDCIPLCEFAHVYVCIILCVLYYLYLSVSKFWHGHDFIANYFKYPIPCWHQ